MQTTELCESCASGLSLEVPATTHSVNPDYSEYALCDDCATEYDNRMQTFPLCDKPSDGAQPHVDCADLEQAQADRSN